ncbi:MAG: hypothetical protein ACO1RA_12530 [Planctomycetaceae bacterium]
MLEVSGDVLLFVHAFATLMMVGLIWFVQVVHYPLMANVGEAGFLQYSKLHQKWTTLVVGPPMLLEAFSAVWLLRQFDGSLPISLLWWGVGLIFVIWLSTMFLQVPMHHRLEHGFDLKAIRFLVWSNWIRTIAWTARGVIALWLLRPLW